MEVSGCTSLPDWFRNACGASERVWRFPACGRA